MKTGTRGNQSKGIVVVVFLAADKHVSGIHITNNGVFPDDVVYLPNMLFGLYLTVA